MLFDALQSEKCFLTIPINVIEKLEIENLWNKNIVLKQYVYYKILFLMKETKAK